MKRLKREHGRIMSVETKVRGDALAEDAAAGATTLTVGDAADFDEDGGWLTINGQVIEYLETDDDEGTITLASGLSAAADEGDAVHIWSTLYDETVDYQEALVELDGEYDNPEPVVAEVAEGVGDLPEGDRGVAGESCTLLRVSDDEWEVVGVGGRGRKSKSIRWEMHDSHTLTAAEIAAGSASPVLSRRPMDESVQGSWAGVLQPPSAFTVDYDHRRVSWPLSGFEKAGDVLRFHYTYRRGLGRQVLVDWQASGWKYLQVSSGDSTDRSGTGFDDSGWTVGTAPFGYGEQTLTGSRSWPQVVTNWDLQTAIWLRRSVDTDAGRAVLVRVRYDNIAGLYWNGTLVGSAGGHDASPDEFSVTIPAEDVLASNTLAVKVTDDSDTGASDDSYADVRVEVA